MIEITKEFLSRIYQELRQAHCRWKNFNSREFLSKWLRELGKACAKLSNRLDRRAITPRIVYDLPIKTVHNKCYTFDTRFADMNWTDWDAVVEGFRTRIIRWYFTPLDLLGEHDGYVVMFTMCAVVDVLSHYFFDLDWQETWAYKEFLRRNVRTFRTCISPPITITKPFNSDWQQAKLKDYADVFHSGVRSSLLHHGDLAPYAGMSGKYGITHLIPNAGVSVCRNHSYPILIINPWLFRNEIRGVFDRYCEDLKNQPKSSKAEIFKHRFEVDFGIKIP